MKEQVSVIMSEYNTDLKLLKNSIQSILNQTYSNFEFIIIDDGGSSNLSVIVDELNDERIKIVKNKKNLGLPESLNKAIEFSNNNLLVRMDTDDIALPSRIEKLVHYIKSHPEFDVVGSSVTLYDENGDRGNIVREQEVDKNLLMSRVAPVHPTVIMKKEAVKNVGGYKDFNRCEDFVLWAELLLDGYRIKIIPDILLKYHLSENDYDKRKLKYRKDEIKARLKYYNMMGATLPQYLSIFNSILAGIIPGKMMKKYHDKNKFYN